MNFVGCCEMLLCLDGFDIVFGVGMCIKGGEDFDMFVCVLFGGGVIVIELFVFIWYCYCVDLVVLCV